MVFNRKNHIFYKIAIFNNNRKHHQKSPQNHLKITPKSLKSHPTVTKKHSEKPMRKKYEKNAKISKIYAKPE